MYEEILKMKKEIKIEKFNRHFEGLLNLNQELTYILSGIYEMVEKINNSDGEISIFEEVINEFIYIMSFKKDIIIRDLYLLFDIISNKGVLHSLHSNYNHSSNVECVCLIVKK